MRVALLGLGAMGSRMAARLLAAGHDLAAWNRSPGAAGPLRAAGARVAPSPRAAAEGAEVVLAMLRDDPASEAVWTDPREGALGAMAPGAIAVECSTLSIDWTRRLAALAGARGVAFLDAPVLGSRPQAEDGALIFLVGGAAEIVERSAPILDALGRARHHLGGNGAGAAAKLAANALFAVQVAALAEALGLLRTAGVDAARVVTALAATPVFSGAAQGAARGMLSGSHAPQFPVELVLKDLGCVASGGAPAPMAAAAAGVMAAAAGRGWGGENLTVAARLYDASAQPAAVLDGRPGAG